MSLLLVVAPIVCGCFVLGRVALWSGSWCPLRGIKRHYTIINFNEVDIRIYLPEKVIIHRGR